MVGNAFNTYLKMHRIMGWLDYACIIEVFFCSFLVVYNAICIEKYN